MNKLMLKSLLASENFHFFFVFIFFNFLKNILNPPLFLLFVATFFNRLYKVCFQIIKLSRHQCKRYASNGFLLVCVNHLFNLCLHVIGSRNDFFRKCSYKSTFFDCFSFTQQIVFEVSNILYLNGFIEDSQCSKTVYYCIEISKQ